MVVQSIALPNVSGSSRDHELTVVPAEVAAPAAAPRSFYAQALVPLIVVTQTAWLALLGYAAFRALT
ncbi:MAG: hypothetical protein ACHP7F_12875 [Actinomycetales bacterium]